LSARNAVNNMNPNDYASLEMSRRLVEAVIVVETEKVWRFPADGSRPFLTDAEPMRYSTDCPALSMAEAWRELPSEVDGYYLTIGKLSDMTKASHGPSYNALRGGLSDNPTDALCDLLLFTKGRK